MWLHVKKNLKDTNRAECFVSDGKADEVRLLNWLSSLPCVAPLLGNAGD